MNLLPILSVEGKIQGYPSIGLDCTDISKYQFRNVNFH